MGRSERTFQNRLPPDSPGTPTAEEGSTKKRTISYLRASDS
jgi:hypothetical protein